MRLDVDLMGSVDSDGALAVRSSETRDYITRSTVKGERKMLRVQTGIQHVMEYASTYNSSSMVGTEVE
jgi:hypothetical protein